MTERKEAVRAWALVDDDNGISLSHLIAMDRRDEYQADLDELTRKLAQKGASHSLRIIPVEIRPLGGKQEVDGG
jgi:hypothetical protein